MSELNQPHDRFFSKAFSNMETVEDVLIHHITPIAEYFVPGTVENCNIKFVSSELEKYYSDLLLMAKLKDGITAYIYFLIEHKSFHKKDVAFDLLGYLMQIWDNVREEGKPLPCIFPVVIYHGKHRWTSKNDFASLVHYPKGIEKYIPNFEYFLFDLSQYDDEEIKGKILTRASLLLLKHVYTQDFGERFLRICKLIGELRDEKTALEFMRSVLEYVLNASDKISKDQLKEGVKYALPQYGEEIMPTLAEQFRQEGRQEGRQEARVEGFRLVLEVKYGAEGLDFYERMKDVVSMDTLDALEEAIRKDASIDQLEQILKENHK